MSQTFSASSGPDENPESESWLIAALVFVLMLAAASLGHGLAGDCVIILDSESIGNCFGFAEEFAVNLDFKGRASGSGVAGDCEIFLVLTGEAGVRGPGIVPRGKS